MHWCYIIVCFHYCLFSLNSASFIQIALFTSAPYRGQKFYHTVCDYVDEICHRLWPLFWILWLDVYILGQLPVKQSPPLLLCFWQRLRFKNRGGCGFFACSWCMLISFFFFVVVVYAPDYRGKIGGITTPLLNQWAVSASHLSVTSPWCSPRAYEGVYHCVPDRGIA